MYDDHGNLPPQFLKGLALSVGILVILLIYLWQVDYFWHYTNDDAYISLRYSRFLSTGMGPYFNPGEHVEGYTNFSLMLFLSAVIRWFGPESGEVGAKCIGVICGIFSILFSYALTYLFIVRQHSNIISCLWAFLAAGIVAVSPAYALNSVSGLETTLFSFFLISAVWTATLEMSHVRWYASGFLFSGALLTRPEGSLLFAVFWTSQALLFFKKVHGNFFSRIAIICKDKKFQLLGVNLLIVIFVFIAHLVFRWLMYNGEWLPNTYYAKKGGFWGVSPLYYIQNALFPSFFGSVGILLSLGSYLLNRDIAKVCFPAGMMTIIGCLLPLVTGSDWMIGGRLLMPYLPLAACCLVIGWSILCQRFITRNVVLICIFISASLTSLWLYQDAMRKQFHQETSLRAIGYRTGHLAAARYLLDGRIKPSEMIALVDIGIIGYECIGQRILDLSGLTDRVIGKSSGGFLQKKYAPDYVLSKKPEVIILILMAPGISYQAPEKDTKFGFWTSMERDIYQNPYFQEHYVNPLPSDSNSNGWLKKLEQKLGAEKIFEHGHPNYYYLLALFRYNQKGNKSYAEQ